MKRRLWFVFCLLLAASWLTEISISQRNDFLQSNQETTVISLLFHCYEEVRINSSTYYYNGVDTSPPQRLDAYTTIVECKMPGEYGSYSFWSGNVAWTLVEPLQTDLHVVGEVEMTVWMSSSDELGLFQGSGYGMGLTDIDEDGDVVKIFEIVGPSTIGNVFSPIPAPYTLTTEMDYVFEEGHTIVFGVGFGSNKEGFTVRVFFDSQENNSGAIIPVRKEYSDILVTPTSWSETLSHNECKTKTFTIENVGSDDLQVFDISESVSWLEITSDPTPISLGLGESTTFEAKMCSNGAEQNAIITIVSDDPVYGDYEITVTLKTGIHDLAIVDHNIPQTATVGDAVELSATIENQGDYEENSTLEFYVNDSLMHQATFTLSPGGSTIKTYLWTANEGTSTVEERVSPVTGETDVGDNDVSQIVTVIPKTIVPWRFLTLAISASFMLFAVAYLLRNRRPNLDR